MNKIIFYVAILAAALATCQAAIKQVGQLHHHCNNAMACFLLAAPIGK
jgi:hypothetical protein